MSVHPELFQLDANTPTFSGSAFAPLYLQCLLFDKGDNTSGGKSHFSFHSVNPSLFPSFLHSLFYFVSAFREEDAGLAGLKAQLCGERSPAQ